MKIRFETTIDDVIAFNRFQCENSPAWRRRIWAQMVLFPGFLAFLLGVGWLFADRNTQVDWTFGILAVLLLPFSIAWAIAMRWRSNATLESHTRRALAERSNRTVLGWREMELANDRLVLKTELIDMSYDLRVIEKIVSEENYTFVYIAFWAFVIPMRLYPEREYRDFVDELTDAWEHRDAPRPLEQIPPTDARIVEKPF